MRIPTSITPLLAPLLALALLGPAPAQADSKEQKVERARTLFGEALQAYEAGRFNEAAEKMSEAYKLAPSPELAFNLARVYERMSAYKAAIRYFKIYLRRAHPPTEEAEDIRKRIAALEDAQKRQRGQLFTAPPSEDELTSEARTFFLRGVAMFKRRQYRAAMEAFTAAQRFAPLPEILYNMAVTSERLQQKRDAIDFYREYLRRRPNAPDRQVVEQRIATLRKNR